MDRTINGFLILLVYLAVAVWLVPFYPNHGGERELADWATAVSLVERSSTDISWASEMTETKFGPDMVESNGAVRSKHSPGLALLAAPIYAISRFFVGEPNKGNIHTSWYVLRIVFSVLPLLILAGWLYAQDVDTYSLAVLLFATPLFPNSLVFTSGIFSAALVYVGFRILWDQRRVSVNNCLNASFLLSLAFLCDYHALPAFLICGVALFSTERIDRFRRVLFFLLGAFPAVLVLLIYNQIVFGNPFSFVVFALGDFNSALVPAAAIRLLGSLFLFSPILLIAVYALFASPESGSRRNNLKIAIIFITAIVAVVFEQDARESMIGPQCLLVIAPLLLDCFFDGEIIEYPSHWRGAFFSFSLLACAMPALTRIYAPAGFVFPQRTYWWPLIYKEHVFANTLLNTAGYSNTIWTLAPAIALLLLPLWFVWREARFPFQSLIGMLVGIGVFAGLLLAWG
ncbi:MAG: hypothetical protein R2684_03645 [Pyrinomonadaceae bacterium]